LHEHLLALLNLVQPDGHAIQVDAVIAGPACEVSHACAGDHGLGWCATPIDTGAADLGALRQGDLPAGTREGAGQRNRRLAPANQDRIERFQSGHDDLLEFGETALRGMPRRITHKPIARILEGTPFVSSLFYK